MQRKVKLRFWNNQRKTFMDPSLFEICSDGEIDYNDSIVNIEQFTGLKDKHGNDIDEGDIVCVDKEELDGFFYNAGVYWSDKRALFYVGGCKSPLYLMLDIITVVGNIHENNELIG